MDHQLTPSGTLGRAILRGIMTFQSEHPTETPADAPTRFVACVTREESAHELKELLGPLTSKLSVLIGDNARGAQEADVVLLGCKPYQAEAILGQEEVREALKGKLILSILAGVSSPKIQQWLNIDPPPPVVRVMPNTASGIGESMTVVEKQDPPLSPATRELVTWMMGRIGRVVELPPNLMNASTALCAAGPAFFLLMVEAMADGAVAMGIPRKEAQLMAAQSMKGAAAMVQAGEHPAVLRDKICTPAGCTCGGLLVLEEGCVRGIIARAVREATTVASEMDKGTRNVNGTRFSP